MTSTTKYNVETDPQILEKIKNKRNISYILVGFKLVILSLNDADQGRVPASAQCYNEYFLDKDIANIFLKKKKEVYQSESLNHQFQVDIKFVETNQSVSLSQFLLKLQKPFSEFPVCLWLSRLILCQRCYLIVYVSSNQRWKLKFNK